MPDAFNRLLTEIRACRICNEVPIGSPLPHEARPVLRGSPTARIAICGQAPGTRVHASGKPFTDPSGDRLRDWMAVSEEVFYDQRRIAIIPMGFCFPGLDAKGGDLPPRKECAPAWRARVFEHLHDVEMVLAVGQYAQRWHLKGRTATSLTETVARWREYIASDGRQSLQVWPLPHPSWRNNAWIKRNPWFEAELLPALRHEIDRVLTSS